MGQARDEAGNIWETDAQGNAVRLLQPAGGAPMTFGTPDPTKAQANDRAEAAAARAAAADARAAEAADRAAREWAATHNPDGTKKTTAGGAKPMPDGVAKRYEDAINAFAAYDRALGGFTNEFAGNALTGELENRAQSVLGTGTPGQSQWWADFRTADNQIRNALFGASLTAGEKEAYAATTITPRMAPEQVRANLERRRQLAADVLARRTAFLKTNGYNPEAVDALAGEYVDLVNGKAEQQADKEVDDPAIAAPLKDSGPTDIGPSDLPPANMPGGNEPVMPASGSTRLISHPEIASMVNSLIAGGAGFATVNAALKQRNAAPLSFGDFDRAKKYIQANPGQGYPINATEEVPLSLMQRAAGSAPGAFVAQMADAATAGTVGALAGERGQGALEAMDALHPNASLAGSLIGGVTGAGAAEMGLAARAPAALARFAPRIADTLYGGLSGFNAAEDGQGGTGALIGAGAGLAGGFIGQKAMQGAGSVLRGVADPAVQALREAGIPLTAGQALGGFAKRVEDRATSIPIVGDMINNRRMEGLRAFNTEAMRQAGEPIGATAKNIGEEGVQELLDAAGNAYDTSTAGVTVPFDQQFLSDLAAVTQRANGLPDDLRTRFGKALENRVVPLSDAGQMTGESYQQAVRGLKGYRAETPKPGFEQDYRDALSGAIDSLTGQMTRGGGDQVVEGLGRADSAYRNTKTLQDAVMRAKGGSGSGENFVFTPSQLQAAGQRTAAKYRGDRPFAELADAGQAVLPSRIPDSGTAGRAAQMLAPGGMVGLGAAGGYATGDTGTGAGLGLGATLALMLGGSKGGQRVLTDLLLNRPDALRVAGSALKSNSKLGGGFGAGILTPLLVGP
jgi:hypothetical protein